MRRIPVIEINFDVYDEDDFFDRVEEVVNKYGFTYKELSGRSKVIIAERIKFEMRLELYQKRRSNAKN